MLLLALALPAIAAFCLVRPALARSQNDLPWAYDALWPVVLRYIRVDLGAPIKDKDREAGYVVFAVTDDEGKAYEGHVELARVRDFAGRAAVRATVDLGGLPAWREVQILQGIEAKARAELGYPSEPPPPDAGVHPAPDGAPARRLFLP